MKCEEDSIQQNNKSKYRFSIPALDDSQINQNSCIANEDQYQYHERTQSIQQNVSINQQQDSRYWHQDSRQQSHIEQLQRELIFLHQENTLNNIFEKLNQKIYWLKFFGFKKLVSYSKRTRSQLQKQQQLKNLLYSNLVQSNSPQQIKLNGFNKLKQIQNSSKTIQQLKRSFFVRYFIDPEYSKLSFAFWKIKQLIQQSKSSYFKNKISRSAIRNLEDEQKLIKFEKQSQKFRAKQLFVSLRNFINKKYLKAAFTMIRFRNQAQQTAKMMSKQNKKGTAKFSTNQNDQSQIKDARFIKKKILPHKIIQGASVSKDHLSSNVLNLGSINLGNYQVKSVSKKDYKLLQLLASIFFKKKLLYFNLLFSHVLKHQARNHLNRHSQQTKQNENLDQDEEFSIMTNVMKNMCFISSCVNKKREKQKKLQSKKISFTIIEKIIAKNIFELKSEGFYSIKLCMVRENSQISKRIDELQEIKSQFLQYFESSMLEGEQIE